MATILYTSLNEIRSFDPCSEGWRDILKGQGKTEADEVLFPLIDCLESNSISDVCWLIGKRKIELEICVKFAKDCADSVAHLKNAYAASSASAYASYASASAYASAYASYASAAYAASSASYAYASADAASYASASAYASYAAYQTAKQKQLEKNRQFLINRIREYEESH